MKNIKKYFKKSTVNKNGYADVLTVVPIILVALVLMVFFIDLTSYAQKYLSIKRLTDNLTTSICKQGQLSNQVPDDYPGLTKEDRDSEYWENDEIAAYITNSSSQAGIENFTVSAEIEEVFGTTAKKEKIPDLLNNNRTIKANYDTNITVNISYGFQWTLGTGASNKTTVNISRVGISEYKHRNADWNQST